MADDDHITQMRLAVFLNSGFSTSEDLAQAVLRHIKAVGDEALNSGELSEEQTVGVKGLLNDIPIAFGVFLVSIQSLQLNMEHKENLIFMLARIMEDLVELGGVAMLDRKSKGRSGGTKSGLTRNKEADETWRPHAEKLAREKRQAVPTIAQRPLTSAVLEAWTLRAYKPSFDTILRFIRALDKREDFPKRQSKKV